MELRTFFRQPHTVLLTSVREYGRDLGKTLQALGALGPLFLLLAIAEGVFPVLTLHGLGAWLDAVLGARSVGAVTSDLSDATRTVLLYFAASAVTTGISEVLLGGRARSVLRTIAFTASLLLIFVFSTPTLLLLFLGFTLITTAVLTTSHVKVRSLIVILFSTLFMSQIFWLMSKNVMVRAYTAGESFSILLLSCSLFIACVYLTLPTYEDRR